MRVHGAFVDDHEVHAVVADWKNNAAHRSIWMRFFSGDQGEEGLLPGESGDEDGESDPLYDEAVRVCNGSRTGVGVGVFNVSSELATIVAARIVEQMEISGVVSAAGHNGAREVLAAKPPRDY